MTQEGKQFVCESCGKELTINKEGKNPAPPNCCGNEMKAKE